MTGGVTVTETRVGRHVIVYVRSSGDVTTSSYTLSADMPTTASTLSWSTTTTYSSHEIYVDQLERQPPQPTSVAVCGAVFRMQVS